ncbi:MAG: hypothetical protein M0Z94_17515 [Dehalococcoidales bacterium]|nr:hypothetical protein [Dehalococcoidales bacterium]
MAGKGGSKRGGAMPHKPMSVGAMKKTEAAMEARGGPKTPAERHMEQAISKETGRPYKGKR